MSSELTQKPVWSQLGPYRVTSELFMDVVFTSGCNCRCPWCISRTTEYARPDEARWRQALEDAFRLFDVRSVILLGGEATIDPRFWEKLDAVAEQIRRHPVEHLILTTNGVKLREADFLERLLDSPVDAVNLSRMHHDQQRNDAVYGNSTLTREEIAAINQRLKAAGKTLRINVNVWRGNLDTPEELERFTETFAHCCDAIKFTPLMDTEMFDTVEEVNRCTKALAIPEEGIRQLFDAYAARHEVTARAGNVLGFVDYAEVKALGQRVILKYAQVEDKYDRSSVIPTLKLYPNGCLSNEWSFRRDVRDRL